MTVELCFSPLLYGVYHNPESVVVVVDVFRATTTMVTAFMNGAASIVTVATIEEAKEYKMKGWLTGAERNVKRCEFADFGNSPFDYSAELVGGKDIAFTTTNGTGAVSISRHAYSVAVGAFINLEAVAKYCVGTGRNVVVLAAGWEGKINVEDTLFGGALIEELQKYCYKPATDSARIALEMWRNHGDEPGEYLRLEADHYERLKANGLESSVDYCLKTSITDIVPVLSTDGSRLRFRPFL